MRPMILALSALASPGVAQTPPSEAQTAQAGPVRADPAFTARAQELLAILSGTGSYETYFTPGFQAAVPQAKFAQVNVQIAAMGGKLLGIEDVKLATPFSGIVRVRAEKGILAFQLAVDPAEPHQVAGLRFTGVESQEKTLAEVTSALDKLHGATGYAFARLGKGKPELTLAHNADQRFAVGSAFKLVILAELVRETNKGARKWDDLVTLDGRPLPGGGYTAKPKGTQVSLRELATQMISISDNSATDILLATLGRENVEAMMRTIGVTHDPRNVPFLGTLEAFKLKWLQEGALADRFNALDDKGQRKMLAGEIANVDMMPLLRLAGVPRLPSRIDTIEWFFSSADLIRVMDWLRRNTDGEQGKDARAVLSKNSGIAVDKAQYPWVGFKGGSEPGVINLTLLLQGKDGAWYAAAASWNDTTAPVEDMRFASLMAALVKFAGPAN
ncbi:MAG: serine hydrolase [Sphingomonadales bacterium]|nr:MAG: serine hydrolase [Sphingomonadales bacterium]